MRTFNKNWLMVGVVKEMCRAAGTGYASLMSDYSAYQDRCTAMHLPSGTFIIFTRDVDANRSGLWKNPDYDKCYHLSLSFKDPETLGAISRDKKLSLEWVDLFFGKNKTKLWVEPPYTDIGKRYDVYHYRLFCNPVWEPIVPKKEVYSKDFTPQGWKSWSDVQAELANEIISN